MTHPSLRRRTLPLAAAAPRRTAGPVARGTWVVLALLTAAGGCAGDDGGADGAAATEDADGTAGQDEAEGSTGDGDGDGSTGSTGGDGEFEPDPGVFVAVGHGGRRARSYDGVEWDEQVGSGELGAKDEAELDLLRDVTYGSGSFVAVGGGGGYWNGNAYVITSTDGVTWSDNRVEGESWATRGLYGVAHRGGRFVAVGVRGLVAFSDDGGQTWTGQDLGNHDARLYSVAASPERFVAVGWHWISYGEHKHAFVVHSSDGEHWSEPQIFGDQLERVVYGAGRFVAIGPESCLSSPDGEAWEDCGIFASELASVEFARGEFFVAHGAGLARSADGLTWSSAAPPRAGLPSSMAYGNGVWVGLRWNQRGVCEFPEPSDWLWHDYFDQPLRRIIFAEL